MDIVERLQKWDIGLHDEAADVIERLRDDYKHCDDIRQSALQSLLEAEKEIERLLLIEQGSAINCDDCGWNMKFPDTECMKCGYERLRKENAVLQTELGLMRSMLPNVKFYKTGTGDFAALKEVE